MPLITFPGLIDMHVHLREPGMTQKGDMETETRAALAGGVIMVCDMPNTIPPTVTVEALRDKIERAKRITDCDIRFFFGVTAADHLQELKRLMTEAALRDLRARCCGVKIFLDHSTGNQGIDPALVEETLRLAKEFDLVTVCHCEDAAINARATVAVTDASDVRIHSLMRPPESEEVAVKFILDLARKTGAHVHPTHLSTRGAIALIRGAKRDGVSITCDVAPHHLFLTVDDFARLGTFAKMNPPLRSQEDQTALWEGIADGTVDCIATDHAPHTLAEKQNADPLKAPSGVPGVETMLPLLLTVAAGQWPGHKHQEPLRLRSGQASTKNQSPSHKLTYDDILRLCFENPNRILALGKSKAAVITIDPDAEWVIRGKELHSKCGWTPYEGWKVKGKIVPGCWFLDSVIQ